MPYLIPTADEIAHMDKRQRDQWRKRMGVTLRGVEQSKLLLQYGDVVYEQATLWERIIGSDPDWREHQRVLIEAVAR